MCLAVAGTATFMPCLGAAGTAAGAAHAPFLVAVPATAKQDAAITSGLSADRCMYIPPGWAERVAYYHSFDTALDRPEINALGAKVALGDAALEAGLAGRGCRFNVERKNKRGLALAGLALPLNRPWTLSMWWRLEEPMKAESGFQLMSMHGKGFMSNFVAGKGPWCALKEPTFAAQVYNWPGISNVNDIYEGPAWVEPLRWHHVALVVSKGSSVRVFWDGALKADLSLRGRLLTPSDTIASADFGPTGAAIPMTIDEVMVLDVPLEAEAIRDYMVAVRNLAAAGVPALAGEFLRGGSPDPPRAGAGLGGRGDPPRTARPDSRSNSR
jgi:hypothetical protein